MIIGGLDAGTTGCKLALYDEKGTLLSIYYQEYASTHKDGEHEIHFDDIKEGVWTLLRTAAQEYPIDALGVTSFGETFALLDENDRVLAPSMLYTDPRGQEACDRLCDRFGAEALALRTGAKPHPMYSIGKLLWMQEHRADLFARCRRILLGEDYLVYMLTGKAQIDHSLAARTGAFDIEKRAWITEIFAENGIDPAMMSTPVPAGTVAGGLRESVQRELGLMRNITVVNGCHDQVAAMIGSGVFDSTRVMDGTGTVECIPVVLEQKPEAAAFYEQGYSVVPYLDGRYACYALSFTGGATLKWFRDNFAEAEHAAAGDGVYALLDSRVSAAPSGLLVLPYFAGAATPYMDNGAKAAILGLTLETDKYAIYRALMEGTSYEMRVNLQLLQGLTGAIGEVRATGGGARSDVWLQIKADVLGVPITALDCREVGAAGTAALAGVAVGAYGDLSVTGKMAPNRCTFHPREAYRSQYDTLFETYRQIHPAIKAIGG